MNLATPVGLLIAIVALVGTVLLEGGELKAFLSPSAMLIVFGGTIGAVTIAFPGKVVMGLPMLIKQAFTHKVPDTVATSQTLMRLAERARREGLLALEEELESIKDGLLRRGVMLVVDGTDPELVQGVLDTEISVRDKEHESGAALLEAMGGFAPTMGIIGTVMGLVHVLANLSDPSGLGEAISVAFIATFYGVASANLLWLPLGTKLKKQRESERAVEEMILEGLASVQAGENPRVMQERLEPYLPKRRKAKAEGTEGDGAAGQERLRAAEA